ncbi:DUF4870 domain-containing protein [Myroides marinus]|uniref:Import component protein n=1 Tax=Myroides marinus TaxID=703342 RepID=A0A161S7S4_9FLAO|nr:import component protein [Myroides marinus]KUF44911.1 import component protein [Myroides marinus]KZE81274.1 import component protein [Myroides marinus]MDM1346366.1 DUF4870 domain-containing protein [Myroides marinus]MDM1351242.1 DUF4870 domain-containing protein [Myroides marinus]MDM1353966.1 DUF4870 domain-containing protein [Myroides marinus]
MDNKTLSIVSYITVIGWIVAFFLGKEKADNLLKYHLRQALGVVVLSFALGIVIQVVARILPAMAMLISSVLYLISIGYMVIGILNAAGEKQKPLPIIGQWSDKTFSFIK